MKLYLHSPICLRGVLSTNYGIEGQFHVFSESCANRWLRISIDRLKKLLIYSSVASIAVAAAPSVRSGIGWWLSKA